VGDQRVGQVATLLLAGPRDEVENETAGEVARVLHGARFTHYAATLIPPRRKPLAVEQRRDNDRAEPIGERAGEVAVVLSVPLGAMKDQQQRRVRTGRPVGKDLQARAIEVDRLLAGACRDRPRDGGQRRRAAQHHPSQSHAGHPLSPRSVSFAELT
jgi:hypothetical protein